MATTTMIEPEPGGGIDGAERSPVAERARDLATPISAPTGTPSTRSQSRLP